MLKQPGLVFHPGETASCGTVSMKNDLLILDPCCHPRRDDLEDMWLCLKGNESINQFLKPISTCNSCLVAAAQTVSSPDDKYMCSF